MFQSFKQRHNNFEQSVNPTLNELQELHIAIQLQSVQHYTKLVTGPG